MLSPASQVQRPHYWRRLHRRFSAHIIGDACIAGSAPTLLATLASPVQRPHYWRRLHRRFSAHVLATLASQVQRHTFATPASQAKKLLWKVRLLRRLVILSRV
jgi:hypothetical protein